MKRLIEAARKVMELLTGSRAESLMADYLNDLHAALAQAEAEEKCVQELMDAADVCTGIKDGGEIVFQPNCDGEAEDLFIALRNLRAAREGRKESVEPQPRCVVCGQFRRREPKP